MHIHISSMVYLTSWAFLWAWCCINVHLCACAWPGSIIRHLHELIYISMYMYLRYFACLQCSKAPLFLSSSMPSWRCILNYVLMAYKVLWHRHFPWTQVCPSINNPGFCIAINVLWCLWIFCELFYVSMHIYLRETSGIFLNGNGYTWLIFCI